MGRERGRERGEGGEGGKGGREEREGKGGGEGRGGEGRGRGGGGEGRGRGGEGEGRGGGGEGRGGEGRGGEGRGGEGRGGEGRGGEGRGGEGSSIMPSPGSQPPSEIPHPYLRCQKKKWPMVLFNRALRRSNLPRAQSKYGSNLSTCTSCSRYISNLSSLDAGRKDRRVMAQSAYMLAAHSRQDFQTHDCKVSDRDVGILVVKELHGNLWRQLLPFVK